jgi:hypothetical protein
MGDDTPGVGHSTEASSTTVATGDLFSRRRANV